LQERTVCPWWRYVAPGARRWDHISSKKILALEKIRQSRLTGGRESVSFIRMRHGQTVAARAKLLDRLPVTGDILRGSLLTRTIRNHAKSCAKCASGEGHQLSVLTVSIRAGAPASSACATIVGWGPRHA
jgi:hypothetical protein